jgi:voltage-gated potassium channel
MAFFLVAARYVRHLTARHALALVLLAVTIVFLGAGAFSIAEHVSYGLALYWAITTATTVGYGDVLPHNSIGRVIASVVMLTTIPLMATVFAIVAGVSVLSRIRRLLGMDISLPKKPYIVVYGTHPVVLHALQELARDGDEIVLVAPTKPVGTAESVQLLIGDPSDEELIRRSDPARASRALIACTDDADTLVIAVAIHSLAPDLEVFALTQSPRVARALHELGVTHTLASDELVGHTLAKSLETPQAGDLLLQLVDTSTYRLRETPIDESLISQPLSKARAMPDSLVLGICRGAHVDLGIRDDPTLVAGDRLIVLESVDPVS